MTRPIALVGVLAVLVGCSPGANPGKRPTGGDTAPPPSGTGSTTSTTTTTTTTTSWSCGPIGQTEVIGSPEWDMPWAAASTVNGETYVGGNIGGDVTLDPGGPNELVLSVVDGSDGTLLAYDAAGAFAWARVLDGTGFAAVEALAGTADGGVVMGGTFDAPMTLAQGQPDAVSYGNEGQYDVAVARFDSTGALEAWTHIGGVDREFVSDVGVLSDGGIVVTGTYWADTVFALGQPSEQTVPFIPGAQSASYVARFDADLELIWVQTIGGSEYVHVNGVAIDPFDDGIVLGGSINGLGTTTFGLGQPGQYDVEPNSFTNTSSGTPTGTTTPGTGTQPLGFLARYDTDGLLEWVIPNVGGLPEALELASDGGAVTTGSYHGTAVLGPGEPNETALTTPANQDVFVARYELDGSLRWAMTSRTPVTKNSAPYALALGADDGVVVLGHLRDTVVFGPGTPDEITLQTEGGYDGFAVSYSPTGDVRCAAHFAGPGFDTAVSAGQKPDGSWLVHAATEADARVLMSGQAPVVLSNAGSTDRIALGIHL